jgi:biopolymer transport protein ExbB/biopolymer transport protein TolQ
MYESMGYFAKGIAITLLLMSVISLSVALAKLFRFWRMTRATRVFAPQFSASLEANDVAGAVALTAEHRRSHVARILGESIKEIAPMLDDPKVSGTVISTAERSIEREQILLATELKSGLGILATVGSTAPFVGLLGTTMGIVNAFQGMATAGGGLEAISAGIAEALITTAAGLLVAIPAVWLYNYFSTKLDVLFSEVAYAGRELVDWLMLRHERHEAGVSISTAPVHGD